MDDLRRVLWHLLGGTRGGPTRARILALLRRRPSNMNQIATTLDLDYKTVQHHMRVLQENRLVTSHGDDYGATWFLTKPVEASTEALDEIVDKLDLPSADEGTDAGGADEAASDEVKDEAAGIDATDDQGTEGGTTP